MPLFNYSILVTGDTLVNTRNVNWNDTDVAFKNCASFCTCKTEINDVFIDEANHIYITIPIYNLIEYSGNSSYTQRSLW